MHQPSETLEQIAATLDLLRQDPMTRRRYPREFWDSIFQLAKTYPLNKICQRLRLDLAYVKSKINLERLDFHEVSLPPISFSTVLIELSCSRFNAKIQGPISCIDHLSALFEK